MKIILSRKGFDSTGENGGFPSPILPDGTLLSLPIPDGINAIAYEQLHYKGKSYADIISELTNGKFLFKECHLDPDIRKEVLTSRPDGWKAAFGQSGAARGHLKNKEVEVGDLFLFFGLFRQTEEINGKYQFVKGTTPKHIIWGYLQIGEIIPEPTKEKYPWLIPHPHLDRIGKSNNTIFVARDTLSWDKDKSGASSLTYRPELVLTKEGCSLCSCWQLPDFMKEADISYHSKDSWKNGYFQSVGRGQEFVITLNKENLLQNWASNMIEAKDFT